MSPAPASIPAVDDVLMIDPPPFAFMCRAARCAPSSTPSTLILTTRSKSLRSSCKKRVIALATPRVVEHHVQPAEPLDREIDESLDLIGVGHVGLLVRNGVAERGSQRLARVPVVDVGDHDARSTSAAKRSTLARPMPLAPPVTIATFPASSPLILVSPLQSLRSMPGREVAEHHRVGDARTRPQVVTPHDGGGAVPGGVQPLDGLALLVEHPGVLVGEQATARADVSPAAPRTRSTAPRRSGRGTGAPCGWDRRATVLYADSPRPKSGSTPLRGVLVKWSTFVGQPVGVDAAHLGELGERRRLLQAARSRASPWGSSRGVIARARTACGTDRRRSAQQGTARLVLLRSYMALPTSMYEFDSLQNRRPSAST